MNFVSKGETPAKSLEKTDKKVYNYRINNTHTFDPSYRGRFMAFILEHQLNIMLFMCGMCGILAVMTLMTQQLPRNIKFVLFTMEVSALILLFFDRICYLYRGDASVTGYYLVRIGNFLVYVCSIFIPFLVSRFLNELLRHDAKVKNTPLTLKIADCVFIVGFVLLLISQFTGLYYTFDESNTYQRSSLNFISYFFPFLIMALQGWSIIRYFKKLRQSLAISILICLFLPLVAAVFQFFIYGVSLINMTTALVVCFFYTYALTILSGIAERARMHEIQFYKEQQKEKAAIFKETAEALANIIDAKDNYTWGHSARVAEYSKIIAEKAGMSEEECEKIYFAGLLHDMGKITINIDIINKTTALTPEEFEEVRKHCLTGSQILSSIKHAPYLSIGAHYHHERYDGKGYPEGLAGENIPLVARIISVADAYDAMTSQRSYREPLTDAKVKQELKDHAGTQFDPVFAGILLKYLENESKTEDKED